MKSKYDNYLYFTDSFDKFLYKNIDNKIYIFDEIKYNFDIKFANYACNSNSIEYRKQIRATNDLEAYYVFIEYLFDYHKSNISFVREQLSKVEKIERDINLKKYVYEEEIDFQNNYNYIVNFSYFNTIIRVIYIIIIYFIFNILLEMINKLNALSLIVIKLSNIIKKL